MRRLLGALSFLTILPVPLSLDGAEVGRAMLAFPLIGALIGGGAVLIARTPLPTFVVAVLICSWHALATGGLHLDGLADSADGFGGGRTRDDVLRIMKDHAIGAFGAIALILALVLKMALISSLLPDWRILILAPMLARWASVPLCRVMPSARQDGLGRLLGEQVGQVEVVGASMLALGGAWWLGQWRALACAGAVVITSALGALYCRLRIGGITGDTLGANSEISELVVYLVWLSWT